ncbi:MAG: hypothetical protein NZ739_06920, partial [Verrucomicrobiae bacterium]|nr:hypothetical protein [Verrucomicrobiae bacterium]
MRFSNLICPRCAAAYPLWRVMTGPRRYVCPCCKSKLAISASSAGRLGATLGLIYASTLMLVVSICGPSIVSSWSFWVLVVLLGYLTGGIVATRVCRFVSYEQLRADANRPGVLSGIPPRDRKILMLAFAALVGAATLLRSCTSFPDPLV